MQSRRSAGAVMFLVGLFVLQSMSQLLINESDEVEIINELNQIERVHFELRDGVYHDALGVYHSTLIAEIRALEADTIIGTFDEFGLELSRPVSAEWLQPRSDLLLLLVDNEINILEARGAINEIPGLVIREYLPPSGLVIQGTPSALSAAASLDSVAVVHHIPIALILQSELQDILLLEGSESALLGERLRIEGWFGAGGPERTISFDTVSEVVKQDIATIAEQYLADIIEWDEGRYEGTLNNADIVSLALQPSVNVIRYNPVFEIHNNNARSHMKTNNMQSYFTTDLDGSGQIVAVADSGLDEDHGDFGSRVIANNDVINDGSTADRWSGHGTHVSCTVLGDGFRGGYAGVAPEAQLYFQAMENDNTGNFQSPSLNSLINSAYNAGARTHTNSWGNNGGFGQYSSESRDVDDRANTYDRYYSGGEGLTVLFAAGNDGPDSDTVSPPATAKNVVTVGMHQNRYQGAPDYIMQGSSRGPVDDGRIKPDVLAPGGYVWSCRAQEAADTGSASGSSTWYLEYTGTSMATPNAAGAAAMIREYLEEIALRESPQGALVKALLILGAEDVGSRDIPNNNEGWGRVNLRNSLAPPDGQGVWVDDRSLLSATGNSKLYTFDIDQSGDQFKAVLSWSDEAASTWSSTQLVNNLNLEVTDPNGVTYLGNDFVNGRSTTGGSADSLNNVEVVLIDSAMVGTWTVEVIDVNHGGSRGQPFALAVMGHGINDLKPDLVMIADGYSIDIAIPSVGEETELTCVVGNTGNIRSDPFDVTLEVDGTEIATQSLELSGGTQRTLVWSWTPQAAGENTVSFIIDKANQVTETLETNNRQDVPVNVSQPGVAITSSQAVQQMQNSEQTSTTWQVNLQNTGLLSTNASISESTVKFVDDDTELNWYVGLSGSQYSLLGNEVVGLTVTVVHPKSPAPGTYRLVLTAADLDNSLSTTLDLDMVVGEIPNIALDSDYEVIPVSPIDSTIIPLYVYNYGNTQIGYDLQVQPPNGWEAYFIQDFTESPFASSSLIPPGDSEIIELVIKPPPVVPNSGFQAALTISVNSQTDPVVNWLVDLPIEVEAVKSVAIRTDTPLTNLLPNSELVTVFSIENKGNVATRLSPTFSLPQGVQVISSSGSVDLAIGESKLYLVTFQLGNSAKSGPAILHLDNGSDRFTWTDNLDIEIFPQPSLQFTRVTYPNGEIYTTSFYGSGSHPAGSELRFTWELTNDADIQWQPVVAAVSDSQLSVSCDTPMMIGYQESTDFSCTVFTSISAVPFSEPAFTVKLSGAGADYTESFSLYIGGYEAVSWSELTSNSFTEGEAKEIQVLVTNTGTLPFNHLISGTSNQDWGVEIIGNGIVDLAIGESKNIKLLVTPKTGGVSNITLTFAGAEDATDATYTFSANAEATSSQSTAFGLPIIEVSLIIFAIIAILIGINLFTKSRSSKQSMPIMPLPFSPGRGQSPPVVANPVPILPITHTPPASVSPPPASKPAQTAICWQCRKPITGAIVGCPKCGARYCGDTSTDCELSNLEGCLSCQSPISTFVSE
tara:strand:- start:4539 stop:9119 length:4581 start_codon:yes stop_codon:yes gene_type:complete